MATFPAGCTLLFGGSGGIGQGVARTFAEQGSDIAVVYRSKRAAADAVADHARAQGRKASVHAADVTDPAPLPDGHRLCSLPNVVITPHTGNTKAMARPLLSARIADNVRRYVAGDELVGLVDVDLGY